MRYRATLVLISILVGGCALTSQTKAGANANASKPDGQAVKVPPKPPAAKPAKPPAKEGDYFQARVVIQPGQRSPQDILSDVGNPLPFTLKADGDGAILIYCHGASPTSCDGKLLEKIKGDIAALALPQQVEVIRIEHATYVPDIVKAAKGLNYPGISVEAAGPDAIRVKCTVPCPDFEKFKAALRELSWKFQPQAPASRVYYLSAADAATALGASSGAGKGDKSGGSDNATATVTVQNLAASNAGPCPAADSGGADKAADAGTGGDAAPNKSADKSGDSGNSVTGCPPAATAAASGDDGKAKDSSKSALSVSAVNGDALVFTDSNPGDDSQIAQKKRVLALIDFPRPEVLINTFSFQASASDPDALAVNSQALQSRIGSFNDSMQLALAHAWSYVQSQITAGRFFDTAFYDYLTKRFVADSVPSEHYDTFTLQPQVRNDAALNLCQADRFCLGYTSLFHPLRPSLTDLLFAVIASEDPSSQFQRAMKEMQGFAYGRSGPFESENDSATSAGKSSAPSKGKSNSCGNATQCAPPTSWSTMTCDQRDADVWRLASGLVGGKTTAMNQPGQQYFPMFCFQEAIALAFPPQSDPAPIGGAGNNLGKPLRAALVNFLFQYKVSQQYPQEFSAYELSQSAHELNSELNPLIVAFNRDLAAALQPIQDFARCQLKSNGHFGWSGHGTNFLNNGIITVRTVSGKETVVDTETQNFFDATNPPSITDVINSVGQAESNIPKVLKTNLTANEAAVIIGALNSVQPATSQVGREFKVDITPRSLSGASSAELDVKLLAGEPAAPTRYSGGKSEAENLSRISKVTVDTKVRLESIKLFEISSFTAVVQQSRRNFPIIPPFVEIPYIGSLLSLPVPGAKEFHRSTAVMSAVVVPTAADLASGVVFSKDRVLFPGNKLDPTNQICTSQPCVTRPALSLRDFGGHNISEFNKKMASCFADPNPLIPCKNITFSNLLPGQ